MGRKTQVTKEQMLQAAYEILKEAGYANVNIKTIAARVGCSTQPISWQFGNMQNLRKELYLYACEQLYVNIESLIKGKNAIEAFFETGKLYISNAFDYPNVFKFICVDDPGEIVERNSKALDLLGDDYIKNMISKELDIPIEDVASIVSDTIIYAHGLATLLLWENFNIDRKAAFEMIYNQGLMCFKNYGIDEDKISILKKRGSK